jgi:hypothetical protein
VQMLLRNYRAQMSGCKYRGTNIGAQISKRKY